MTWYPLPSNDSFEFRTYTIYNSRYSSQNFGDYGTAVSTKTIQNSLSDTVEAMIPITYSSLSTSSARYDYFGFTGSVGSDMNLTNEPKVLISLDSSSEIKFKSSLLIDLNS